MDEPSEQDLVVVQGFEINLDLSPTAGVSKVWPAELFVKSIYTHFELHLDRIMLEIPIAIK